MKRPIVMLIVLAAICLVGLPAWALLSKGGADASPEASVPPSETEGLELFQINCGACHTLAAAGTDGVIGPNLDQILGTGDKTPQAIEGNTLRVLTVIKHGRGGRMPAGLLQGQQAREVARFVSQNLAYVGSSTTATNSGTPPASASP
jgi:mono/diheme cytochrome c family protein